MSPDKKVPTNTTLIPLIKRSLTLFVTALLVLAYFIDAPLQTPADPTVVPNPSKSAWFLLWMQEMVSYSNMMIYAILGMGFSFFLFPKRYKNNPNTTASWFQKQNRITDGLTLMALFLILTLTIIAAFFRGPYWQFVIQG